MLPDYRPDPQIRQIWANECYFSPTVLKYTAHLYSFSPPSQWQMLFIMANLVDGSLRNRAVRGAFCE